LQVFRRFLITALAPIMYNFGIIAGILFFVPRIGIQGLAWGVVLGGVLHLLIQVPLFLKVGFKPEKIFNWKEPGFREVIKLTIPRSIGLATIQINLIIVTAIASTLATGSIAIFSLAENLSRPLYTFFAVSFSTAAFPTLSLAFSKKAREKFNQVFLMTFRRILLFTLPAGIILFIFRGFFVKIILQAGKFGSFDASLTAACFGLFCLGIFAEGLTLLLAKAFYALHDTKTPTLLSIFDLFLTLILCLVFIKFFSEPNYFRQFFADFLGIRNSADIRVVALPLGISLSAIFQFLILSILFWRKKAVSLDGDSQ
jgi:putative peptidoglycan lipid II flippase